MCNRVCVHAWFYPSRGPLPRSNAARADCSAGCRCSRSCQWRNGGIRSQLPQEERRDYKRKAGDMVTGGMEGGVAYCAPAVLAWALRPRIMLACTKKGFERGPCWPGVRKCHGVSSRTKFSLLFVKAESPPLWRVLSSSICAAVGASCHAMLSEGSNSLHTRAGGTGRQRT